MLCPKLGHILCHNPQENIIFPKINLEQKFKYSNNWGEQPLGYGATVANIHFDTTTSNLMTLIFLVLQDVLQ